MVSIGGTTITEGGHKEEAGNGDRDGRHGLETDSRPRISMFMQRFRNLGLIETSIEHHLTSASSPAVTPPPR